MAPITAEEVAKYLEENPDFFLENSELVYTSGLLSGERPKSNLLGIRNRLFTRLNEERRELINLLDATIELVRQNEQIEEDFIAIEKILFQETLDKRIVNFFKKNGLETIEIKANKALQINKNLEINIVKFGYIDSALIVKSFNHKILNLKLTKSEKQTFVDTKHLCSNKYNLINSDEYNEKDELVFTNIDKFLLSLSKQTLTI